MFQEVLLLTEGVRADVIFWGLVVVFCRSCVVYPDRSSSSGFVAQLFGHRHAVRNTKQVLSLSCIFGSFGVRNRSSLLLVFWWKQYHDTAISGTDYLDFRNRDNFCSVCVGKHVTVSRYCCYCARV